MTSSSSSFSSSSWSQNRNYAVLLDAGSSGTRLQVYSWLKPVQQVQSHSQLPVPSEAQLLYEVSTGTIKEEETSRWKAKGKGKFRENGRGLIELKERENGSQGLKKLPKVEKGTWDGSGKEWSVKQEPGLSSFSSHPQDLRSYLTPLFDQAISLIPASQISSTPVYLLATAGMRLLPKDQRVEVLKETCRVVRKTGLKVIPSSNSYTSNGSSEEDESTCGESVKVISGEEEGLLGWIAINYLMDGFTLKNQTEISDQTKTKMKSTFGFLDMGGASTQIAFEPSKEETKLLEKISENSSSPSPSLSSNLTSINLNQPIKSNPIPSAESQTSEDLTTLSLNLLDGTSTNHKVFVTTFLGFGTNVARERYGESLWKEYLKTISSPKDLSSETLISIPDPCLPVDLILPFQPPSSSSVPSASTDIQFKGTGDFLSCLHSQAPLLDKHAPCNKPPCLFHGVHVPKIDFEVDRFVGVSEYWFSANDIFKLGGLYSFPNFQSSALSFCSQNWSKLSSDLYSGNYGPKVDLSRLQMQCFKAAWMTTVLHEGIGLPRVGDQDPNPFDSTPNLSGNPASNQEHDHAQASEAPKKATNKNLASFQSVNDLGGLAVSWTLGKAVLEASREVGEYFEEVAKNGKGLENGKGKTKVEDQGEGKGKGMEIFHPSEKLNEASNPFPKVPSDQLPKSTSSNGGISSQNFIFIGLLIGVLVLFLTKRRGNRRRRRGRNGTGIIDNGNNNSDGNSGITKNLVSTLFIFGSLFPRSWRSSNSGSRIVNGRGDYHFLSNMEEGGNDYSDQDSFFINSGRSNHRTEDDEDEDDDEKSKLTTLQRLYRKVKIEIGMGIGIRNVGLKSSKNRNRSSSTRLFNRPNLNLSTSDPSQTFPSLSDYQSPGYSKAFPPRVPSRPGSGTVSPVMGRRSTPPIPSSLNEGRNSPVHTFHSSVVHPISSSNGVNLNHSHLPTQVSTASTSALSSRASSPAFGLSVNQPGNVNGVRRSSATSPAPTISNQRVGVGIGMGSRPSRSGTNTPIAGNGGRNAWGEVD